MTATDTRRVSYIHSPDLQKVGDALPSNLGRSSLVHSLISSYGLIDDGQGTSDGPGGARAKIVKPSKATRQELLSFHDEDFIGSSCSLLSRHYGYWLTSRIAQKVSSAANHRLPKIRTQMTVQIPTRIRVNDKRPRITLRLP